MKRSINKLRPNGQSEKDFLRDGKVEVIPQIEPWRVLRITSEIVDGIESLRDLGPAVTLFGSARTKPDSPLYKQAEEVGALLSKAGYAVITGGGPGIMEAVNKGAQPFSGPSVGLNIELPFEQHANPYLDVSLEYRYFFVRKMMFVKYAFAFVMFPGGFGTMDEFFEVATLIQTGKIERYPLLLYGKAFWGPMIAWMRTTLVEQGYISTEDPDLFKIVDRPEDVLTEVDAHAQKTNMLPANREK